MYADPTEHVNLARAKPQVFTELLARVDALQRGVYSPTRSAPESGAGLACERGIAEYDGWWGPFLD